MRDAIASGIFNDLGSGSNIDLCVIRKGNVDYLRPYDQANVKGKRYHLQLLMGLFRFVILSLTQVCSSRQGVYDYKRGTTAVLSVSSFPIDVENVSVNVVDTGELMDTSS